VVGRESSVEINVLDCWGEGARIGTERRRWRLSTRQWREVMPFRGKLHQ
jgi:hypothetical protein